MSGYRRHREEKMIPKEGDYIHLLNDEKVCVDTWLWELGWRLYVVKAADGQNYDVTWNDELQGWEQIVIEEVSWNRLLGEA